MGRKPKRLDSIELLAALAVHRYPAVVDKQCADCNPPRADILRSATTVLKQAIFCV